MGQHAIQQGILILDCNGVEVPRYNESVNCGAFGKIELQDLNFISVPVPNSKLYMTS